MSTKPKTDSEKLQETVDLKAEAEAAERSKNLASPPGLPLEPTNSPDPSVTPAIAAVHRGGATVQEFAVRLYTAYAARKVIDNGLAMPPWSGLTPADQQAWIAVAEEV